MAQVITPELEALLEQKFPPVEVRGEIEIDRTAIVPGADVAVVTDASWASLELSYDGGTVNAEPAGWKEAGFDDSAWVSPSPAGHPQGAWATIAGVTDLDGPTYTTNHAQGAQWICRKEFTLAAAPTADPTLEWTTDGGADIYVNGHLVDSHSPADYTDTYLVIVPAEYLGAGVNCIAAKVNNGSGAPPNTWANNPTGILARLDVAQPDDVTGLDTLVLKVATLNLDRSRKMAAAQLDAVLANEAGALGWYSGDGVTAIPNNQVRAFAWLNDSANRVRIFTGILDRIHEHRNPKTIGLKARSRMKWLVEQKFRSSAPQLSGEDGAVRTEDNGVYLSKTIGYIVADIAARAGWPAADVVIDASAYAITLAEYVLSSGGTWVDQLAGADRLTTAAGCDLVEDELGILRFEPSPLVAASEPAREWDFAAGVNVLSLDHEVDDEDRATRVEVTGPMTSAVPKWEEVWSTAILDHPAGAWYDPADADYLRVIDRVTKYIYRIKQSDRSIASKKYLGGYPLGLSGDPTDATHYYVLHAPWRNTGSTSGNSVKRYLKSDNSLVSTSTLPNGRWSALKFNGTHLWLTNYDDGKLYKKTYVAGGAAAAVASYTIVDDDGETQTQATGMWLNGTSLGLFFAAHKRFLLVDTSAPTVVTGAQSTMGTRIAGGESDTDTDIDLYAVASKGSFGLDSGMVAKFTLAEFVTTDVSAVAIDYDLEDTLGQQSGIAARDHDGCPNSPVPHAFEARLATYSMKVVQSLAQAGDVADAQLSLLKRLRRVVDLATLGHPGVQLNDPVGYTDAIAACDLTAIVDSYRVALGRTYVQTMSVLPWEAP